MTSNPPMSPEEIEARDRAASEHTFNYGERLLWAKAWEAARHYYRLVDVRKATHVVQGGNDPEGYFDDYELSFIRHLIKKAPKPFDEGLGDISGGDTYWKIRKGKTWEDIDRALADS